MVCSCGTGGLGGGALGFGFFSRLNEIKGAKDE